MYDLKKNNSNFIVEIYAIQGHSIYMKYYPLGNLRELINNGKADKNRYSIADDICRGLSLIHSYGYVHSDLKSRNILCEEWEMIPLGKTLIRAVISDFGATRKKGEKLATYTVGF